jgi:trehalose-6-phosphate synthase
MIDATKFKDFFQQNDELKGKIINVVNQIPFNCFLDKLIDTQDEKTRETIQEITNSTPISHLERRRRSTIIALGQTNIWKLATRRGHSAMYAALDSLKKDYRTLYIGGTGAILSHSKHPIDSRLITDLEKASLTNLLDSKHDMIPIFIEDKLSYGHYEGYSKQSKEKKKKKKKKLSSGLCLL